ncbi:MAG: OmpA family protein [Pseudomonadota bacterium]
MKLTRTVTRILIISFFMIALLVNLSACTPFVRFKNYHFESSEAAKGAGYGAAGGAIIAGLAETSIIAGAGIGAGVGGLIGADLASEHHWLKKLQKQGVQVVQIGEHVRIIVPSDRIFYFNSPTIIPQQYPLLEDVSSFIKHFGTPAQITVAGFTDNVQMPDINLELSRHQAQSVTAFLWSHGFPFRTLRPVGYGEADDTASNDDPMGSAYNRRIEISFFAPERSHHHFAFHHAPQPKPIRGKF